MTSTTLPGGTFALTPDHTVPRLGYGAMQLSGALHGAHIFGPPADRQEALAVLRTAIELGIRHIDTADFYGPYETNQLIAQALHPYVDDLTIVTKVGSVRSAAGDWVLDRRPNSLRAQVYSNLANLKVDALDVVNLRLGGFDSPQPGSIAEPFETLVELQQQGLIKHLGLSTVDVAQIAEARAIAPIVSVQNFYNIVTRTDDAMVDALAVDRIAFVPYFPLGGFSPLQSATLTRIASRSGTTAMAVALAWLLQRSPNILLIPGTSSVAHLRENVAGVGVELPEDAVAELDAIAG